LDVPTDTDLVDHAMIDTVNVMIDIVEMIDMLAEKSAMLVEKNDEVAITAAKIVEMALTINRLPERVVMPIREAVATTTAVMNTTPVKRNEFY